MLYCVLCTYESESEQFWGCLFIDEEFIITAKFMSAKNFGLILDLNLF